MSHESYRQDDDLDHELGGSELMVGIVMCFIFLVALLVWIAGIVAIMSWLSGR
jgi:hypothetical protein